MLQHLSIQNFALIERHDISFDAGMSVLTGETGAGKSILIDAINLVLGGRADSKAIRHGAERCDITAEFDIDPLPNVRAWLIENALDQEGQCILRRTINADGKSRAFINGQSVTAQQLSALGEQLINIHGQHEHQLLLKRDQQRFLLDEFGQHDTLLQSISEIFEQWQTIENKKLSLTNQGQQKTQQEFLQFQYDELLALNPQPNEFVALEKEYKTLSQSENILQRVSSALTILDSEEQSISEIFEKAHQQLSPISEMHENLTNALSNLAQAKILTQEAIRDVQHFSDHLNLNPERLAEITQRMDELHRVARKHRIQPEALVEFQENLKIQIDQLAHLDVAFAEMEKTQAALKKNYVELALKLSKKRQQAAKKLSTQVSEQMQALAMSGGEFIVKLLPLDDGMHAGGLERCEFWVQPNPGQAAQPLAKIASGGELSRISLAIQVILASHTSVPTLIFDEVDVGIGGATATVVGKLLKQLGEYAQVLCVTHLPQVAAFGHHHYQVQKNVVKQQTSTALTKVMKDTRESEIARMLGGTHITAESLAHARALLDQASQ